VGQYTAADKIKLTGTPDFYLTFDDGTRITVTRNAAKASYSIPAGKTLTSFTDASGAPGLIMCKPPVVQTLKPSAAGYCTGSPGVQLALRGTEPGAIYQLFKNNVQVSGMTLTGTGGAATFSGVFDAGAYTAKAVKTVAFCADAMAGAPTVTKYALPGAPTAPSNNARCDVGQVIFSATAPAGCTIDWYDAASNGSIVSGGNGVTLFAPSLTRTGKTIYYAQARNTTTGCVSTTCTAATGTANALPTISQLSGNTSQILWQGEAIATIQYTTDNAVGVVLDGQLPEAVNGLWSRNTYTISGTTNKNAATTTYNYTVTPVNTVTSCQGLPTSGKITVSDAPSVASSPQTWIFGNSPLVWSDRILVSPPNCTKTDTLSESDYTAIQYKEFDGRYYYTWSCADKNSALLCPSPWRIPTKADFDVLKNNASSALKSEWGHGGLVQGSTINGRTSYGYYWSSSESDKYVVYLIFHKDGGIDQRSTKQRYCGLQIRCVK
jgi:hypothetical protein